MWKENNIEAKRDKFVGSLIFLKVKKILPLEI